MNSGPLGVWRIRASKLALEVHEFVLVNAIEVSRAVRGRVIDAQGTDDHTSFSFRLNTQLPVGEAAERVFPLHLPVGFLGFEEDQLYLGVGAGRWRRA